MFSPPKQWQLWPIMLGLLTLHVCAARPTFNIDSDYLIDTWETEDGLPENSATAMVQTPEGYLWFGTFNGLVQFDGARFTVFDPANTPQLPAAGIVNLHLDGRGWLWVSTYRGLVVREGSRWRTLGVSDGWAGDVVRTFAERRNGELLLTTFNGEVLEFANGRLSRLPSPPGRKGVGYFGLADEAGRWWVVQQWCVSSWDGHRWVEAPAVTNLYSTITGAGAARDGGIWLKAGPALYKLRQAKVSRIPLPDWPGNPWSITEDSRGNVWIATYDHGLWQVDASGQTRQWTSTNGLSYNGTRFVFEDRERNLWVGTSGGGLQRFKLRRFHSYGAENGLADRNVTSVWPDASGGVWLATFAKGMFRWSGGSVSSVALPPEGNTLNVVNSVLTDRAGRTWFGTLGQSVCVTDSRGFRRIPHSQFGGFNILSLFEDSRGRIWVGGERQVSIGEDETFRAIGNAQGGRLPGVRCFAEDREGVIWASNLEGLYRCEKDLFVEVRQDGKPERDITTIKTDSDGTIWLGLTHGGLIRRKGGSSTRINLGTGPAAPGVHGIVEDDAGYFWMPSRRGVLRAARKDLVAAAETKTGRAQCLVLDLSDGLPSVECAHSHQPVCSRDGRGRLWFATLKGAAMIDPAEFRLNTNPPPIVIESLVFQAAARDGADACELGTQFDAPFPERVVLPAGSRRIEIRYAAPSFTAPEKVRFQFKLEGIDADWRDAGAQRTVQFHELEPNVYTLRVRAANNDDMVNEAGASLTFVVQPFIWQTGWFRVGAVVLLMGAGGLAVWWRGRWRHQRELAELERQRRQQSELAHVGRVATMGQLSSALAHELNQPLCAILSNAEAAELFLEQDPPALDEVRAILADIRKDDQRAGEVIQRMRRLLKRRELELTPLAVGELVEQAITLLRPEAMARKVAVEVHVESGLPPIRGDWVHLQQVLLNLMLNAMDSLNNIPAKERRVVTRARRSDEQTVEVSVGDNGEGIPEDKLAGVFEPFFTTKPEGLGMGLSLSQTIIQAHGGRIWAQNNAGGGATLRFTLPIA